MPNPVYNLERRTCILSEEVLRLVKTIRLTPLNRNIVEQLLRSATSTAANYMEADVAESKKDFLHKIGICKKEAKETTYWLSMLVIVEPPLFDQCKKLRQEAHELMPIFSTIVNNGRKNMQESRNIKLRN